jgi:hypothetical protein
VLEQSRRRGWEEDGWDNQGKGEEQCTFSLSSLAGRWMISRARRSGAPACYRETSERSRPRWKSPLVSPNPARLGFHIKSGPSWRLSREARAAAVAAELLRGPVLPSLFLGDSGLAAQPRHDAPRAARRDDARPGAPARPPGAGPLPGAPGASRPSARGWRDSAGQDVPARQPLGGG